MNQYKSILADTLCVKESHALDAALNLFQSPQELLDASEHELMQIHGVGPQKARQIAASIQLAKLMMAPKEMPTVVRSPEDVFRMMHGEMAYLTKEHFVCLFLNTKNGIIGRETISIGSLNAAVVHPRCVFRAAIKRNSASIICVHNHPSGDPTPSNEDITLSQRLVEAGSITGVEVLDSMVIGHNRYVSLKEQGHI